MSRRSKPAPKKTPPSRRFGCGAVIAGFLLLAAFGASFTEDSGPAPRHRTEEATTPSVAAEGPTGSPAGSRAGGRAGSPTNEPSDDPATMPGDYPTNDPAGSPVDEAYRKLAELDVKGRAPKTGYAREEFGQRWSDDVTVEFGHDGCDTRNNILARDLTSPVFKPGTHGCVVLSGHLADPYSGAGIDFERGRDTSSAVQIDHIVPLSDAWQKGAQFWDPQTRQNFANDPRNLLAVDGPLNMQKGDGDAATWLPPNKAFRCDYARRIIDVKHAYSVWVTLAEAQALHDQLDTCQAR